MDSPFLHIDDFGPVPIRCPKTVAELGDEVRRCREQKLAVYPVGGRTHLAVGAPPKRAGVAIETVNLKQVIDYPARDLTITVQAGIRVQELQALLAGENQRLAVDIPRVDQATLGGALAVNASGPRRFGCGTLRDYLIGVSFVNDDGNEIKSGGRVVKNVAGYDMCKLLVGSLGTLGIITQATLKLRPLPESQAFVSVQITPEKIGDLLDLIHSTQTRPCCVELVNPAVASTLESAPGGWLLLVGFEENLQAVTWQIRTLREELCRGDFVLTEEIHNQACGRVWQWLTNFSVRRDALFRIRASVPPQALAEFCKLVAAREEPWEIQAHAGNGIVRIQGKAEFGVEKARDLLSSVQSFASAHGGNAVVEDCPPEWKSGLPIWGVPRDDFWLMRRVKASLDPDNMFNPGRFVDGI